MSADEPTERSADACPQCGEHTLAILRFPHVDVVGVQLYNELYGFGDLPQGVEDSPAIGCLNCGAEWPSIEAFKRPRIPT